MRSSRYVQFSGLTAIDNCALCFCLKFFNSGFSEIQVWGCMADFSCKKSEHDCRLVSWPNFQAFHLVQYIIELDWKTFRIGTTQTTIAWKKNVHFTTFFLQIYNWWFVWAVFTFQLWLCPMRFRSGWKCFLRLQQYYLNLINDEFLVLIYLHLYLLLLERWFNRSQTCNGRSWLISYCILIGYFYPCIKHFCSNGF